LKPQERLLDYNDYLKLPDDGKRYEIVEGELFVAPSPNTVHQRVSRNLEFLLHKFVSEKNLGEIFYAPLDVILGPHAIVQPDIIFISKERLNIIGESNIQGAPDLLIEVLSPSNKRMDLKTKLSLYEKYGVEEYWVVDPHERFITVFTLNNGNYRIFCNGADDETITSYVIKGLEINLSQIWG